MASKKETAAPKNIPSHGVYVVEGEGEKAFWTKVGCAWSHSDGEGYNVTLTALPVNGRLVIRTRTEKGER
ncbi:hypothetical protein [Mesorhizobium sp.]|uniref:hypothetical protein n=1 Tax=Mesorhizobium sp. TaxID=1871066 RepID=UPI0025EE0B2F|nr:hypothetical protein [Mesorhizobium sp.]